MDGNFHTLPSIFLYGRLHFSSLCFISNEHKLTNQLITQSTIDELTYLTRKNT